MPSRLRLTDSATRRPATARQPSVPPSHSALATLDAIGDAVLSVDVEGVVTYMNLAAEAMTGWARARAIGRPVEDILHLVDPITRQRVDSPLTTAMARNATVGLPPHSFLISHDGRNTPVEDSTSPIHDAKGRVNGAVIVFRDVTATLARSQEMAHAALHDPLTGLANRLLLLDRLSAALSIGQRRGKELAVAFLDVDGFKATNDTRGHAVGDGLLRAIALRLTMAVRRSDTVSRYGGDEFVVVLTEIAGQANIPGVAATLLRAGAGPHRVGPHDIAASISLGIALYPRDGHDAETLIANADRAMYDAKAFGTGRYRMFDAGLAETPSAEPRPAAQAGAP